MQTNITGISHTSSMHCLGDATNLLLCNTVRLYITPWGVTYAAVISGSTFIPVLVGQ